MFDREIMELNCLAFAEAGESPCQMQPDEKARVCPASHLSIPRMDVRRKREGGKRRVIVRRGGKEEAEKESKEENKAERPSRRREMEEVEGSVATLDVQCPPLSAELLKNVLSVPSRKTKPRGDVHSRRQQQLQVAHMLRFGFLPAAQLMSGN